MTVQSWRSIQPDDLYPTQVVSATATNQVVFNKNVYPSTDPGRFGFIKDVFPSGFDYSGLKSLKWIEEWMLDPPDSYPFVEWDDLSLDERVDILQCRMKFGIAASGPLDQMYSGQLVPLLHKLAAYDDQCKATKVLAEQLRQSYVRQAVDIENVKQRLAQGTPGMTARGHMMASESQINRAQGGYTRRVVFRDPVDAFTLLDGDRVAFPGDMVTAMTLEDSRWDAANEQWIARAANL